MNKKKIIIIASAIVLVAIAGIAGYRLWPDQNRQINAAPLNTAVASKGDILVGVSGSGAVSAINSESIRTKEAGKVDTVMVKKGDVVEKGAVLITFVAGDLDDKLKEATKSLENLKTELKNKQESYKTLAMNNATEEELESAKKAIDKANSDIVDGQESIAAIHEDMAPPDPLTAPIDGTITAVNITDGEQAQNGTELFTMTDYVNLSVTVQVDELDIPQIKLNQASAITLDALEDKSFTGKVIDIAKEGTSSNGVSLFNVTVGLNDSEGVLIGMSAEVAITIEEKKDILTVPIEAVTKINGKSFVNVPGTGDEESGRADRGAAETKPSAGAEFPGRAAGSRGPAGLASGMKRIAVEAGIHNESSIEIVSGLSEGDEVILPTVISSGNATSPQLPQQGGMGGMGGFGGGGGTGGGAGGGMGGFGGGGFSGGGGGR
ncbi:efflux RND transporter periplasmic adaptor subunit [Paenibacillus sp. FSL R7-0302]|uniref:efflux RND transporter periplasmic adaptor subunit n=1 Tax=Paenibacillus sp. FSL R7-0302 TaxID=2921681 RepID=UPI0030F5BBCB